LTTNICLGNITVGCTTFFWYCIGQLQNNSQT